MFSNHLLKNDAILTAQDIGSNNYPIGMSLETFLNFWNDIKSLNVSISIFQFSDPLLASNFVRSTDIQGGLQLIDDAEGAINNYSLISAAHRTTRPIKENDTDITARVDYPILSAQGFEINLGKSKYLNNIFYPYISVSIPYDQTEIIGGITFEDFGTIPIYGPSSNGITSTFAAGSISVSERFSNIKLNTQRFTKGGTFRANHDINLNGYSKIYFGPAVSDLTVRDTDIEAKIPTNARGGAIYIEKISPYDLATLNQEVILG